MNKFAAAAVVAAVVADFRKIRHNEHVVCGGCGTKPFHKGIIIPKIPI